MEIIRITFLSLSLKVFRDKTWYHNRQSPLSPKLLILFLSAFCKFAFDCVFGLVAVVIYPETTRISICLLMFLFISFSEITHKNKNYRWILAGTTIKGFGYFWPNQQGQTYAQKDTSTDRSCFWWMTDQKNIISQKANSFSRWAWDKGVCALFYLDQIRYWCTGRISKRRVSWV